jgi:hypothetical protein
MAKLNLITRQECSLCEEAARDLRRLGIDFAPLDVDQYPDLKKRFDDAVPVLLLDGVELARAPLDGTKLRIALARAGIAPARR